MKQTVNRIATKENKERDKDRQTETQPKMQTDNQKGRQPNTIGDIWVI